MTPRQSLLRFCVILTMSFGLLAVLAAILTAFLFLPHTPNRQTDAPFGAYAGYVWLGRVSSVQGVWRVPAILAKSHPGLATTWIGAQGAGIGGPFIQVGTAELRGYSRKNIIEDRYWAFWSDKARRFHPQKLFLVKPGDRLTATAGLTPSGWRLVISDVASRRTAALNTGEAPKPLDAAQWTQEDALTATGARYTYPLLASTMISHLLVNSTVLRYTSLYSTWMSINGTYLAPSPLRHDGFLLQPTKLTSIGKHYLSLNIGEGNAVRQFGYELESWTTHTSHGTLKSAASRLVAALHSETRVLKAASLPPAIKETAASLVHILDAIIIQAYTSPSTFYKWRARLTRDAYDALYVAHLLRRDLKLPELP
jgi:hypothetical protein